MHTWEPGQAFGCLAPKSRGGSGEGQTRARPKRRPREPPLCGWPSLGMSSSGVRTPVPGTPSTQAFGAAWPWRPVRLAASPPGSWKRSGRVEHRASVSASRHVSGTAHGAEVGPRFRFVPEKQPPCSPVPVRVTRRRGAQGAPALGVGVQAPLLLVSSRGKGACPVPGPVRMFFTVFCNHPSAAEGEGKEAPWTGPLPRVAGAPLASSIRR